jgi:hypothetical protein
LLALVVAAPVAAQVDLASAGVAAGHAAADSVDGYAADALIGLGAGVLFGVLDSSDHLERGFTREDVYTTGLIVGGGAALLSLILSEWRTDPPLELVLQQRADDPYRIGFIEGYSSRMAHLRRVGGLISTATFLIAHGMAVSAAATDDGTGYPLFSVHMPVGP